MSGVRPGVRRDVDVGISGRSRLLEVFPVRLGNSGLSLSRRAQYETAIATGNALFLLYLSEVEDVGV